jgi:signal transduction histidine kinase
MSLRILFIDSDEHVSRGACDSLMRAGYNVSMAASANEAREAIAAARPDVLLVNHELDGHETGLDFLRALRASGVVLPAILCTGYADEQCVFEALRSGVADIVPKNAGYLDYLPAAVERVLRDRRVESKLAQAQRSHELVAHFRALAEEREALLAAEREARELAERASRIKDEFVATLSHELRTPLNAIVGWTQCLLREKNAPDSMRKGLEVIDRNARAQARMVDDLLDFSRMLSGKLRLDLEHVDPVDVVDYVVRSTAPSAEAKEIRIVSVLEPCGMIFADPARLQQIVCNLLSNAVKFTGKGGLIEVRLSRDEVEGEVELVVSDNGQGITPEFLPHVFERFCQEDAGIARRHGGLGLGLSIAQQLVEMQGGRITAKSDGPGRGATFIVVMPSSLSERSNELGVEPLGLDAAPALAGLRVLVVDDEPDACELVERVLQERGATTTAFGNATEALVACMAELPDVIVSDIGMPGVDGYEFIRRLRVFEAQCGRTTPAAALTAFARSEDRRRALLAGFQTHVAKPVDPLELVVVVAALAGRATVFDGDAAAR